LGNFWEAAIGVIGARLIYSASERAIHIWLQNISGLDELMDTDFSCLSQDRVYKVSDKLLKYKQEIEEHLNWKERNLFNLQERIILYSLTNTFFEGSSKYNQKVHFGHSKERGTDCPLVTLGLVLDSDGFPKKCVSEQEIWDIYNMLRDVEDAFSSMKSELGLRPVYHQKEFRVDGHLFITIIAYHILHTIRFRLRQKGIHYEWGTIRHLLSTHVRISTRMKRKDGKMIYIRKSSRPELSHKEIYDGLNLSYQPGKTVKVII